MAWCLPLMVAECLPLMVAERLPLMTAERLPQDLWKQKNIGDDLKT